MNNLIFLCLEHHSQYDARGNQSKGITKQELLLYRNELDRFLEAAEKSVGAMSVKALSQAPLTILVVDDEIAVSECMALYAAEDGHRVVSAGYVIDVEVVKALIERYQPDGVILDVAMNFLGGDGVELYFQLRQAGYSGKIIFYTNYGCSQNFLRRMILSGVDPADIFEKREVGTDFPLIVKRLRGVPC